MGSQVLASTQHTTRYRCCVYLLSRRPNKQNFKMKISLVLSLLGLSVCSASPQFDSSGSCLGVVATVADKITATVLVEVVEVEDAEVGTNPTTSSKAKAIW